MWKVGDRVKSKTEEVTIPWLKGLTGTVTHVNSSGYATIKWDNHAQDFSVWRSNIEYLQGTIWEDLLCLK